MLPRVDTAEDPKSSRARGATVEAAPFLFAVLECPRPSAGGSRHALDGVERVVLGRGAAREVAREGNRLTLRFPSRWLSALHAELFRQDAGWRIEDRGSTNGTSVNGQRIDAAVVVDGDVIEVGRVIFMLRTRAAVTGPVERDVHLDGRDTPERPAGLGTLLPSLEREIARIKALASGSSLPVLLLGETGTGKEMMARAVHRWSRRPGPFVAVNCGALTRELAQSQLFGHVRGAYTGATRDEPGLVRAADRGTLLLDEIGDLDLDVQVMLLRVLQEKEVLPVGGTRGVPVDVRVIAATHQPLWEMTRERRFRDDLLARLDGVTFYLPPLRDRPEDIGVVLASLLERELGATGADVTLEVSAGMALIQHGWPFNVREAQQAMLRALATRRGAPLVADDLALRDGRGLETAPAPPATAQPGPVAPTAARRPRPVSPQDEALRGSLVERLQTTGGNVTEVARSYGKARAQVHRWMRRFGIDPTSFRRR